LDLSLKGIQEIGSYQSLQIPIWWQGVLQIQFRKFQLIISNTQESLIDKRQDIVLL